MHRIGWCGEMRTSKPVQETAKCALSSNSYDLLKQQYNKDYHSTKSLFLLTYSFIFTSLTTNLKSTLLHEPNLVLHLGRYGHAVFPDLVPDFIARESIAALQSACFVTQGNTNLLHFRESPAEVACFRSYRYPVQRMRSTPCRAIDSTFSLLPPQSSQICERTDGAAPLLGLPSRRTPQSIRLSGSAR